VALDDEEHPEAAGQAKAWMLAFFPALSALPAEQTSEVFSGFYQAASDASKAMARKIAESSRAAKAARKAAKAAAK
jgi:hypothetical protein